MKLNWINLIYLDFYTSNDRSCWPGLLNLEWGLNFLSEKIAKLSTTGQTWCEAEGFSELDYSSIQIIKQILYLPLMYLFRPLVSNHHIKFCNISNLIFRKSPVPNVKTGWDAFPLWWELMNLPTWSMVTFLAQFSVTIPPMFQLNQSLNAKVKIYPILKNFPLYI